MKRIGMILDEERGFPPDIRVQKESQALLKAGFEVSLLAQRRSTKQAGKERLGDGLEVFRINIRRQNVFQRQLRKITLFKKNWFKSIGQFIHLAQPNALHTHDFNIVPTALRVARRFNMPLVADLHENMPAAHVAYRADFNVLNKLESCVLKNYYLWRWHEKRCLPQCIRIIAVVPEATERLIKDYGISPEKICIVSNTEDHSTFDVSSQDHDIIHRYQDSWTAIYIGGIDSHRGVDTALRSAPEVGRTIPRFKLLIVGVQTPEDRQRIMKLAQKTGAAVYLELLDWVPPDKVSSYIAASDACLVPYNDFEHTNTTVPHKLFQYMIMKKPVVVSSCRPLKRIVEETQCGLVFKANDPRDLARCLLRLYNSGNESIKKYGDNGQKAALGDYCWKNDSRRLVKMYRDIFHAS